MFAPLIVPRTMWYKKTKKTELKYEFLLSNASLCYLFKMPIYNGLLKTSIIY
ncbi:hypothetical protein JCM6292_3754 [Bacteroides pyogenes JCM 6292]|uniref:Uncharacterized protein n=2 Tax=Bacteroides pyogenes TaxID=310300 RepID=W4PL78_9BACE|nr:hypothetical protein JCM6292_3754 [Bacteroides pyogenes JCM 6292]GAE20576.1 hypothetical protein JCM6294_3808 [Bacteroides pyogenes DSM 20611 = JCM 6294]